MANIFDKLPKSVCDLYINDVFWQTVEIHDVKARYFYPVLTTRGTKMAFEFERKEGTNEFHFFGFAYAADQGG